MYSQLVDGNDDSLRAADDQHNNYDNIQQHQLDSSGVSSLRDSTDVENSPQLFTPVHQRNFQLERSALLRRIEELEKENIRLANRSKTTPVAETKLANEHAKLKQDFQVVFIRKNSQIISSVESNEAKTTNSVYYKYNIGLVPPIDYR